MGRSSTLTWSTPKGGVNGQKIELIALDDKFDLSSLPKTRAS